MDEENAVKEELEEAIKRIDWEKVGKWLGDAMTSAIDAINDIADKMRDYLDVIVQAIELRKEQGENRQRIARKKRPPRCIGTPCAVYLRRARPHCRSNC